MAYVRNLGALVITVLALLWGHTALAATFTVTKTADTNDGSCDADCSLREAVVASNASDGVDEITLPAGVYVLDIDPNGAGENASASGDLDFLDDGVEHNEGIRLLGAGAETTIIDGAGIDRVIHIVGSTFDAEISGVTLRNGNSGPDPGGGLYAAASTLRLSDCAIRGNTAGDGGGIRSGRMTMTGCRVDDNTALLDGGGIWSNQVITLTDCAITGNTAGDDGGGIYTGEGVTLLSTPVTGNAAEDGGGIYVARFGNVLSVTGGAISGNTASGTGGAIYADDEATVTLIRTELNGNEADEAGGLYISMGVVKVSGSSVSNNTALFAGGFYIDESVLTMTNGVVSGNVSEEDAGGIFSCGDSAVLDLTSSTISGNTAGAVAAAVYVYDGTKATFTNCTITANTSLDDQSGALEIEGPFTNLVNTIVAGNFTGPECSGDLANSLGHNIASDASCNLTQTTDLPSTDPLLAPLQDNGGSTQTHALLSSANPAVDAGDNLSCPFVDQRGLGRSDGDGDSAATCDIGAFEFQLPGPQSKAQQKCILELNKGLAKVAKAQGKHICKCIKQGAGVGACVDGTDPKVTAAQQKTRDKAAARCSEEPGFGPTDPNTVNRVAVEKELAVVFEIFGSDLDVAIPGTGTKAETKCQATAMKQAKQCQDTKLKLFNKCKKSGLKGKADPLKVPDPNAVPFDEPADLAACMGFDPKGEIAKVCGTKLESKVSKACSGQDLARLFPGDCAASGTTSELAMCIDERVECQVCLALNVADGLFRDCDDFDDGVANGSCGDTLCGNGVLDPGEVCDPPGPFCRGGCNLFTGLCVDISCQEDCTCPAPVCGDGIIDSPNEECDDGNNVDGDGCSADCLLEGEICGGIAGLPCPLGEFCEFSPGTCGAGDLFGVCTELPIPCVCPAVFDPVCGCDGNTYGNACEARCAEVSIAHEGPCD